MDRMCGRIDWAELWQCKHYILFGSYMYEVSGSDSWWYVNSLKVEMSDFH
jgi:hypothetical protein